MKHNHGFIILRAQPFHKGHKYLIDKILFECKFSTVILGSTQESRTEKNPFTYEERREMVENVYRNHPKFSSLKIFGLPDLPKYDKERYIEEDMSDGGEWYSYVLKNIRKEVPESGDPDAFYCGNEFDGHWFDDGKIKIEKVERSKQKDYLLISATEIRAMLKAGDNRWKNYIPTESLGVVENSGQ